MNQHGNSSIGIGEVDSLLGTGVLNKTEVVVMRSCISVCAGLHQTNNSASNAGAVYLY